MTGGQLYERIGHGYAEQRRGDPRIEAQLHATLGDACTIVNVGAGTGNYEPPDRDVIAVEPSATMIAQRTNANPVVQARAEALPFPSASFDVALAILTVHHWSDRAAGLVELARVSERQMLWIYDTGVTSTFWMMDYFPTIRTAAWEVNAPTPESIDEHLHVREVRPVMVPLDCTDGFSGAYWGRPERYLDPEVQAGMSTLARLDDAERQAGTERLRSALATGEWDAQYGHLRQQETFDIGYRLAICEGPRTRR